MYSSVQGTFMKIDPILNHNTVLNKFERTGIFIS